MLLFVMAFLLAAPGFAGLLEEVDELTPEEAALFQQKLQLKQLERIPGNTRGSFFVQFIDPAEFNNTFPGVGPMTNLYGGSFDLRFPLNERILIGGNFGGAGNYVLTESGSKIYEDLYLGYGKAELAADLWIIKTDNLILSAGAGAGVILGGYKYSNTDDNTQTDYTTDRWGSGLCTSLSLDLSVGFKGCWRLGIGASSFSGKLGGMRKIISGVDKSAPEIDLTGMAFRISASKGF